MSHPAPHGPEAGSETPKKVKNQYAIAAAIIIAFIVFVIIPIFHSKLKNSNNEVKNENSTPTTAVRAVVTTSATASKTGSYVDTIGVDYGGNYGEEVPLPSGFTFGFIKATQPYNAINRNDEKVSGKIGEDAAQDFPTLDGEVNRHLRFRSQNGKSGHLTILLICKN